MNVAPFFELFVNRADTYAVQTDYGYTRIEEPLTEEIIQKHLDGKIAIGTYQFNNDNKVKWVCFDFDGKNLEEQFQYAKLFFLKLRDEEKIGSILLEFSGRKGYHVWVFCKECDGASAKYWAEEISKGHGAHDIFPKQAKIDDKYGNLVKMPLCIHQISGKRSVLFNPKTLEELTFEQSIELLERLAGARKFSVPKIVIKEVVRTVRVGGMKGEVPSFIQNTIRSGVKEGERHKWRFIITKELYHLGYDENDIMEFVNSFNKNCNPPESEYVVERHIQKLLEYPERYLAKEIEKDVITPEELDLVSEINYNVVMDTYKKWIRLNDYKIIDACMAVAISRKLKDVPLWLILIAPSGSGKTEIIRPLEDKKTPSTTELLSRITRNTFLSGKKDEPEDFANTLENNPKLFLTFDFAQFVKLNSEEKAAIWAQLRDIYDGFIERKAAFGVHKRVNDIKVNWIICTTPVIDTELLVQQELGTRELLYRFREEDVKEEDLMEQVWQNSELLVKMRKELSFVVRKFIEKKETEDFVYVDVPKEVKDTLKMFAVFISVLRADTESDSYTGELINFVYKEMPTRVLLQLKLFYTALKNLDENYSDARALAVIRRVALSSIHPVRLKIILTLMKNGNMSTNNIQKSLSIGWKTVNLQLYTAKQLDLVDYTEDEFEEEKKGYKTKTWFANDKNKVIGFIRNIDKEEHLIIDDFLFGGRSQEVLSINNKKEGFPPKDNVYNIKHIDIGFGGNPLTEE